MRLIFRIVYEYFLYLSLVVEVHEEASPRPVALGQLQGLLDFSWDGDSGVFAQLYLYINIK